jgi:peroxiredoxin
MIPINREDGKPARGANLVRMQSRDQYKQAFEDEIALYPDNYSAYSAKWRAETSFERDKVAESVRQDLERLTKQAAEESPQYWRVISFGNLLLKQEEKSREAIKKLIALKPKLSILESALEDYADQTYSNGIKGAGPDEVRKLAWGVVAENPKSGFARSQMAEMAGREEAPLASIEMICRSWIEERPDHPKPYLNMALAYETRRQNYDEAAVSIEKAITLLLQRKALAYGDSGGVETEIYDLPLAYKLSAKIAFKRQQYPLALTSVKMAQALAKNPDPGLDMLEAQAWEKLSFYNFAEKAYLSARGKGSPVAEELLKAVYQKRTGSLKGFEEYLKKKAPALTAAGAPRKPAPDFKVTTLDGNPYDLATLRGKVAVLNFWYIGCAPCNKEMPQLNQLVDEYRENKDVVFLAIAPDEVGDLKKFLKTREFKYQIVPNAQALDEPFSITSFPTHFVIDRQGQMAATFKGALDDIHVILRRQITQLLNE